MPILAKLGWRNLWRNRRRTLLTMTAMGMATALVIVNLGIYDGMIWDMIEGATESYHGHAKVMSPGYLEERRMRATLPADGLGEGLRERPGVVGVSGRLKGYALLSAGRGEASRTQPAELLGIVPADERGVTRLAEQVSRGRFLAPGETTAVVLGAGLAKQLEAGVGDELAAMGQAADGSIAQGLYRVVGILETGDPVRDASLVLVPRGELGRFLVLPDRVHTWVVRLDRPLEARGWASRLDDELEGARVHSWQEIIPTIAMYLDIWVGVEIVFALIFYFAVVLVTANTMTMSFFERIREFAVMGAIGLKPGRLSRLIVFEGLTMSVVAGLVGGAVGIAGSFLLYRYHIDLSGSVEAVSMGETVLQPRLRSYPTLLNTLMPIGLVILLGVLVSLFPARRLRKLRPVDALREV